MKKLRWLMILCAAACLLWGAAAAEEIAVREIGVSPLTAYVPLNGGTAEIRASEIDGETWLFLPAFAEGCSFAMDGEAVELDALEGEAQVLRGGEAVLDVNVMRSENLRALFLLSDDPVNEGREFIDNCEKHENETTGSMVLVGTDGVIDHSGRIRKLRGRGNGTWTNVKKPYQMKLEDKVDLLDSGDSNERERTWVLLAEASGSNMLQNRIAMDIGLELGLEETGHCEHIDLYYDGEYRGTYLLSEKVEIGEGRVDETDYDEMIELWNEQVGQTDLEALTVAEDVNRFGNTYTYLEKLAESGNPGEGAFLLEMEMVGSTLSDRCYFRLSDGGVVASKNPENASKTMMDFISTRLQEARDTLENGGVNPENGRTLEDDFDLDAFARTLLTQELAWNYDGYTYSSSFFVLPAGEMRFRPGPLWDFDLAWRYQSMGQVADAVGFKNNSGWMDAFYQCDDFVNAVRTIWREELYPMVRNVLLGEEQGEYLRPLSDYADEIAASSAMNEVLWQPVRQNRYLFGLDREGDLELLRQFIDERSEWLNEQFSAENDEDTVLWFSGVYAHVDEAVYLHERPWNPAQVQSFRWEQLSEATEEDYALWLLEIELSDGGSDSVWINGTEIAGQRQEDGTLLVQAHFEDPSYRPVDYYGDDIGWVYNPDFYLENHPEALDMCDGDTEMLMDYFCDDGMYEDHMGNAFFRPSEVLRAHPEMMDSLGEDWQVYYWDYLYYGRESDKWTLYMGKCFWPEMWAAE